MRKNYYPSKFYDLKTIKNSILAVFTVIASLNQASAQQTYTFTTAGVTGKTGPTQSQVTTAYGSTNLSGLVTVSGGIQSFTLNGGLYRITAYGAAGGPTSTYLGGRGAMMQGDFNIAAGSVLKILVGQKGEDMSLGSYNGDNTGGGGGSFVWITGQTTPLVIAGGGGGAAAGYDGIAASITTSGTVGSPNSINNGSPGTAGNGANPGGGGWYTPGQDFVSGVSCTAKCSGNTGGTTTGGASPTTAIVYEGCAGTDQTGDGGFGGGSGGNGYCSSSFGAGGGGGYSGGCGQYGGSGYPAGGGGGGSFNAGANQVNTASVSVGNGTVIIQELCNITVSATTASSINAICSGNSATLTTNAVSNFSWSTGATTSSIVVSPTSNTVYSLSATSASACIASAAITITVSASAPSLSVANTASASGGICPTKTVNLNATGALSYTWTGATPTITNGVTFAPTTPGSYTVAGTNGCGTTSVVVTVSVHPLPTVSPVASSNTLCSGTCLSLTATGNATAYVWSNSVANGACFYPAVSSTYTVIGTSALSCTNSATIPVTVVTTPSIASIASPSLICIGNSSTLTALGASSYTWTDGTTVSSTSVFVVTPASPGITTYTITRSNSNCVTSQQISVITNSLPTVFAIASPTIVCALQPATLAIGGGQSYTWTSPGMPPTIPSFTFSGASPLAFPPVTTIYTVAASDGTCVTTTTVMVAANPNPTITSTANPPVICSGQTATINATGGINYTITSSLSTATVNTLPISQVFTVSGSYNITGDNSFGCTNSISQVIIVNPNPVITASVVANKTLVCSSGSAAVNAVGADTYSWSNGALTHSTIVNPVSLVSGPIIFTVTGTNTTTTCHSDKTVAVNVFIPTITVTGNTSTCLGGNINLAAGGGTGGNNYRWYTIPGAAATSSISSLSTTLGAPAVYTITALTTSLTAVLCPSSKTIDVNIFFNPTITAVAQRTPICVKESVVLTGNGGDTYLWNTGGNTQTISVSPNNNTTYTVTGTDINGCSNTGTVLVKVSGCVGLSEQRAANIGLSVYPNPSNGEFTIQSASSIKLSLVNDLGQLIRVIDLSGSNNYKVCVNDLAKGIYFLTGTKDNVQVNQKVIIAK